MIGSINPCPLSFNLPEVRVALQWLLTDMIKLYNAWAGNTKDSAMNMFKPGVWAELLFMPSGFVNMRSILPFLFAGPRSSRL